MSLHRSRSSEKPDVVVATSNLGFLLATVTTTVLLALLAEAGMANAGHTALRDGRQDRSRVRVVLGPHPIDLFHSTSIRVSGIGARSVDVRPVGAIDRAGLAYRWTPYRWRALRAYRGTWRGLLSAPPLFGVYELQIRIDHGRRLLASPRWLLRVFPSGTMKRPSFTTALAAVHAYVADLAGDETLVALKRWPLAPFDHRDPRLNRLFVIAYAPRGHDDPGSQVGKFITTIRDGYHGRWRLLQATSEPPD